MRVPGEFPNIQPVISRDVPEGMINAQRATPSDFGDAGGLEGLARGIDEAGRAADSIATDQAQTWAATAAAQQELNVRQQWQQKVNGLDPTSQDYPAQIASLTDNANETWDKSVSDVQDKAPNGFASTLLGRHLDMAKTRFQLEAMQQQSQLNAAYTGDLVKQGISADSDLISASPDNNTFDKAAAKWQATIGGYKTIDPIAKGKLNDYALNQLANAQAQGAVTKDPGGFLASISPQGGISTTRGEAGQVPAIINYHANFVQPFTADKVAQIAQQVKAPSKFDPLINEAAQKNGIDPKNLKLFLTVESGLNPNADNGVSHGIAQMTDATAKSIGVNPADPAQAIEGSAELLAGYKAKYGGDVNAMTAAYYGGPDPKEHGANTQQYAANLAAVRSYLGMSQGDPQVQPLPEEAIASAKPPLDGWDHLTWPEKVGYVRRAEATQGKALSAARGKLRAGLQDSMSALANGVTPSDINDPMYSRGYMTAVLGADAGSRAYTELQYAKQEAGNIQQMATMPLAQRNAMVENAHASAAGVGAAENFKFANIAAKANAKINAMIKKDPMNYAVQTGIGGAQPLDLSSDGALVKTLANRQAVNQTMVRDQGAQPAIFTKQEQQQISDHVARLSPDARVDFLVNMRRGLTDDRAYQTAMNQIAGPQSNLAYAGNIAVHLGHVAVGNQAQSGLDVARMIAEGDAMLHGAAYTGAKKDGQPGSDDPALPKGRTASPFSETKFAEAFGKVIGGSAAFQGANAGYSQRMHADTLGATEAYFAAWARHNGVDTSNLDSRDAQAGIQQAINAVTGGVWKGAPNKGVLFAPWGMPMAQFQNEWNVRATRAFSSAGYADKDVQQWLSNATPVNVGDGRYQFTYRGVTINRPGTRKPVEVNYGDSLPQVAPEQGNGSDGLRRVLSMFAGRGA